VMSGGMKAGVPIFFLPVRTPIFSSSDDDTTGLLNW
jgi:hypothetical protein